MRSAKWKLENDKNRLKLSFELSAFISKIH